MYRCVGLSTSRCMKKMNHYLNLSISRAVFPKWDFEPGLFRLSESEPKYNGLRRCFVYLVRKIIDT